MNDILYLKGHLEKRNYPGKRQLRTLPDGKTVNVSHMINLHMQLSKIYDRWSNQNIIQGALLSLKYTKIAAKSNRIKGFFSMGAKISSSSSIVGAKFIGDENKKHLITHFISLENLKQTLEKLEITVDFVREQLNGSINSLSIEKMRKKEIIIEGSKISTNACIDYIVDSFYLEEIFVNENIDETLEKAIITIYDIEKSSSETIELMKKIGISISHGNLLNKNTMLLQPSQLAILKLKAPYLISMAISDLSEISIEGFETMSQDQINQIPKPKNEPTIGVIDSKFDTSAYFSKWVDFHDKLDPNIPSAIEDALHGTAVSSIIVDGPSLNPELDDECGRFKVRHFAVASGQKFSSFTVLRLIQEIIETNKDIKVWNLSLGSILEINENSISPEASILDEIQCKNDVIFVVAGTNKKDSKQVMRIGSPADSINSLVVNAVDFNNKPASYTRVGPVLSFFNKPDVSYYGGDINKKMKVFTGCHSILTMGTSFAAPWISRKLAYLINIMGLSREVAKALIIDAASRWENKGDLCSQGYGIVPIKIQDIIKSKKDEIKFILSAEASKYETYTYNIPVPISNSKYEYITKATLCYFPKCDRNQGVDYTCSELNIKFGRIGNDGKIKPINDDVQDYECNLVYEKEARKMFRKWDNIKQIIELFTSRKSGKKVYPNRLWGLKITKKERGNDLQLTPMNFAVVVTLREINGVNRIDDFINQCSLRGWLVNRVDIKQQVDVYNILEESIEFDEDK